MKESRVLLKTDRNGTEHWQITESCPRCGGSGIYAHFGTCFLCGGDGRRVYVWKKYTPEHEAKLEAQRAKRAEARAKVNEEKRQEETARNRMHEGFNADGVGFVHYGDTFAVKETLKKGGAKWCGALQAWIAPKRIDCGVRVAEIKADDVCTRGGFVDWDKAHEIRTMLQA